MGLNNNPKALLVLEEYDVLCPDPFTGKRALVDEPSKQC